MSAWTEVLRPRRALFAVCCLFFAGLPIVVAQAINPESGRVEVRNFSPRDYGAAPQNWCVVQDPRGLIYVGNTDGVVEYDGVEFRLIPTAKRTGVRSLAVAADGRIYVGGQSEFGYLGPGSDGALQFFALSEQLPEEERAFADVWWTWAAPDGVYFQSQARLFRYAGGKLKSWKSPAYFLRTFLVGPRLLVSDSERGLLEMQGDELVPLAGIEPLKGKRIVFAMPLDSGAARMLIVTDRGGFFVHDGVSAQSFATTMDAELSQLPLYNGMAIAADRFGLATLTAGLLVMDTDGRLLARVDQSTGLRSNQVLSLRRDYEGAVWLGLGNGLARVDALAPLSRFGESDGANGLVTSFARQAGTLYAGSTEGLMRLKTGPARFVAEPELPGPVWGMLAMQDGLLVAHNGGAFWLAGGVVKRVGDFTPTMALLQDRSDPARVWVGHHGGVASLRRHGAAWMQEDLAIATTSFVRSLAQDASGALWLGTEQDGILRLTVPAPGARAGLLAEDSIRRYTEVEGLPAMVRTQVLQTPEGVLFQSGSVTLRFDADTQRFSLDPRFSDLLTAHGGGNVELPQALGKDGRYWLRAAPNEGPMRVGVLSPDVSGVLHWDPRPLAALSNLQLNAALAEDDGVVWLGTDEGIYRFDTHRNADYQAPFHALVRRVARGDAMMFRGVAPADAPTQPLAFGERTMRFAYAATSYATPSALRFQTQLRGQDQDWSEWSAETYREYTNLREGEYLFQVRARSVYGGIGQEDRYAFAIAPPWYRTWWSYVGAAFAFALLLWGLLRWRVHRLEGERARLEQQVDERTRALAERGEQLQRARDAAESAARAKSDFLATMSHEIRTPMNAIIGFSRLGEHADRLDLARSYLHKVGQAGDTLLGLVNDVLDFSKIEAGRFELEHIHFDLHALLLRLVEMFAPRAAEKRIDLLLEGVDALPRYVVGDPLRLNQVLINLVGNAMKFTEQGSVRIAVASRVDDDGVRVDVSVSDTGIGIEPERIEGMFDAFTQADVGTARRYGGTGLGLSISRRLVRLMGGDIAVVSDPRVGSTFRFDVLLQPGDAEMAQARDRRVLNRRPQLAGVRVLLVEDNAINQEVAIQILARAGVHTDAASGGREALALLDRGRFDAVLMDVHMPEMDGYATTARIRAQRRYRDLPIIAITAHAVSGYRERCLAAGMNDFLTKPFEPEELLRVLAQWTESGRPSALEAQADAPDAANAAYAAKPTASVAQLPILSGFDTVSAMRRLSNDLPLYRRLLAGFARDYAGFADRVGDLLKRDEFDSARRLIHSFRGVAANLGANALAQAASALEVALLDSSTRDLAALESDFRAALGQAWAAAAEAGREQLHETEAHVPIDLATLMPMLDTLTEKLGRSDPTAEALWLSLRAQFTSLDLALVLAMDRQLEAFDFSTSLQTLERLRARIKAAAYE